MKKMISLIIIAFGLIMPLVFGSTIKIYPSDDAYTDQFKLNVNYNTETLWVGSPVSPYTGRHRTYLKFDLSGISGQVTEAKLSLDPTPVNNPNIQVYYVSIDGWSENTITWNNAPNYNNLVDSKVISSPNRLEFDVMSVINEQDNILSLMLKSEQESTSNIYVQFYSSEDRQGETWWPYLQINYEEQECNTVADTDCDGCVSLLEMVNLMLRYKNGETQLTLLEMVNLMLRYKNGEITC